MDAEKDESPVASPPKPAARKLPVRVIVGSAYRAVFHPFYRFLSKSWAWALVSMVLPAAVVAAMGFLLPPVPLLRLLPQSIILYLMMIPILAGLAVMWHRSVQLNEDVRGLKALRLRRREWRFIGLEALILLALFLPLIHLVVMPWFVTDSLAFNLSLGLVVILGYAGIRLALTLPLIAIDETAVISKSWRMMKGNALRLVAIVLLAWLPIAFVVSRITSFATAAMSYDSIFLNVVFFGASAIGGAIVVCLVAGALSFSLMHLRGVPFATSAPPENPGR